VICGSEWHSAFLWIIAFSAQYVTEKKLQPLASLRNFNSRPATHRGGLCSSPGQDTWDLWRQSGTGAGFLLVLQFPCQSFLRLSHTHQHCNHHSSSGASIRGQMMVDVPNGLSLTKTNIKVAKTFPSNCGGARARICRGWRDREEQSRPWRPIGL
jgi:hypothetical protein